jgi:hypothetical protein
MPIEVHLQILQEHSEALIAGRPGPKWASWSYKNQYLSARFHSNCNGFEDFISWLKSRPYCSDNMVAYPQNRVLAVCLGIGLILHDIHTIQFELGESNEDSADRDTALAPLKKSKLDWAHSQALLQMCITVAADLKECLEEAKESARSHGQRHASPTRKPASKRQKKEAVR